MSDLIKVQDGDQTIEVEPSALEMPEGMGLVTPDSVPDGVVRQEVMNAKMEERVNNAKQKAKREAASDEAVRNQVLSEIGFEVPEDADLQESIQRSVLGRYGIEVDESGKPKGLEPDIDIEKERNKWKKQNLEPVKTELDETRQTLSSLQNNIVRKDIRGAFAGKAKDEYLDAEHGDSYVEIKFNSKFKYNRELGKTLQVDDDGNFEMHPNGASANGHGYIEPEDFIKLNSDSKLMKRILKDDTQAGSDFQGGAGGDPSKMKREQFEKLDPRERQKKVEEGVEIVD